MNTLLYDNEEEAARRGSSTRLKERPMLILRVSDDDQLRRIYDFGDELGRGRFGVVLQARARLTRTCWAIKVINKNQAKYPGMMLVDREIRILRLISHPNIIHLEKVYESPKKLYLVFELCASTLAQEFSEHRPFSEPDTRDVIRKLSSAVAYLHRNGIVHRDLKLENILLTTNPADPEDKLYIKVTDFGQSVVRSGITHEQMLNERCGTMTYMAPEVFESRMYSHQCDVWSMGVITYVLLLGEFPFLADNAEQLKQRVLNDEPQFGPPPLTSASTSVEFLQAPTPVSDEAKAVITSMLAKKPEFRITAAELCVHPWLLEDRSSGPGMNVLELMNSMMEADGGEGSFDEHRISRISTRGSNVSTSQSITLRQSECASADELQQRVIRAADSDSGPAASRLKNVGIKGARPRAHKQQLHLPPPPPPNAVAPVFAVIDGRHQSFGSLNSPSPSPFNYLPGAADRRISGDRRKK